MHAVVVEAVPARALGALAVAVEIGLALALVDDSRARRARSARRGLASPMSWSALSNSSGLERWVMSPVWIMNAGFGGSAFDLADRLPQRAERVGIGGLVEADMAVADLEEGER